MRYYVRNYGAMSKLFSNFFGDKGLFSLSFADANGDDSSEKIQSNLIDGNNSDLHCFVYNGAGCLKVNSQLGSVTYSVTSGSSAQEGRFFFSFLVESITECVIAKIGNTSGYIFEFSITNLGYLRCSFYNSSHTLIGSKTINIRITNNKWNSFGFAYFIDQGVVFCDMYLNKAWTEFDFNIASNLSTCILMLFANVNNIYYTNIIVGKSRDYDEQLLHKLCIYADELMQTRYVDSFNSSKAIASFSSTTLYNSSAVDTYFFPMQNDLRNFYGDCLGWASGQDSEVLEIDTASDRDFVYDNNLKHYTLALRKNHINTTFKFQNSGFILARVGIFKEDKGEKILFSFDDEIYLYLSNYNDLCFRFRNSSKNTLYEVSPEQFNTIGITWMKSISSDSIPVVTYSIKVFINNNIYSYTFESSTTYSSNNIIIGGDCYLKMEMLYKGSTYLSDASIFDYVNKTKYTTIASEYDTLGRQINYSVLKTGTGLYKKKYSYKKNGIYDTLLIESETDSLGNLYEYTYDNRGNLETIKINNLLYRTYEYNFANQLTKEILHDRNYGIQYNYDSTLNNLISVEALPTGISPITMISITYDTNGPINKPLSVYNLGTTYNVSYSNDLVTNISSYAGFNYSYQGRKLAGITHNNDIISYHYDEEGNRDKKAVNDNVTYYYYSNGKLIAEVSQQLNRTIKYLYNENDYLFGFIYNGSTYYYLKDCFGLIKGIIDDNNTIVVSYEYDAFGNILSIGGSLASTIGQINPIRYKGYYYDNESGLYYLKNRYYNPELRLFIQADDVSYLDPNYINGFNLYCYCYNNPIIRIIGNRNVSLNERDSPITYNFHKKTIKKQMMNYYYSFIKYDKLSFLTIGPEFFKIVSGEFTLFELGYDAGYALFHNDSINLELFMGFDLKKEKFGFFLGGSIGRLAIETRYIELTVDFLTAKFFIGETESGWTIDPGFGVVDFGVSIKLAQIFDDLWAWLNGGR